MKYYLWVLGCAMNTSDAERIAAVLDLLGYKKTDKENEADLIITVACSVRQTAIDRIYGKLKVWRKLKIKNRKLKIVLTGCVLEVDRKKMTKAFDAVINIEEIGMLPEFLGKLNNNKNSGFNNLKLSENLKLKIENSIDDYFELKAKHESTFRAYVPIMTGCNNFCSYCAVPYTRGREKSRKPAEVIEEVKNLVKDGFREITLLGQNVNSYEFGFVELLKSIDQIKGDFRVYFYSNHPKDMSDGLIKTLPKLKHYPAYIHLPLQSGNNQILKEMNRQYTRESYLALVEKIRKYIPGVTLTTDIIVGYPGETTKEFSDTKDVMKRAKFDMAFIAQYSPRPGSKSFKLSDSVSKKEKVARDKELVGILAKTAFNSNLKIENTVQKVLIDGEKNGKYFGRTGGYKVVEIKTDRAIKIGRFYDLKIIKAESWKLVGSF